MISSYIQSVLGEREEVLYVTRRHWFLLFSTIVAELVIIAVLVAAVIIIPALSPDLSFVRWGALLVLIPLATLVRDYLVWQNLVFIVTNRRVIQASGVFNKNLTDSSLEKVTDVKMSQSVMGRMFNYGDVEILTASEAGINLFKQIEDPIGFKTAMLNAKEHMTGDERPYVRKSTGTETGDIPGLISELAELRRRGILTEEEFQRKKGELLDRLK